MTDKKSSTEEKKPVSKKKRYFVHPVKSVLATDNKEAKHLVKSL